MGLSTEKAARIKMKAIPNSMRYTLQAELVNVMIELLVSYKKIENLNGTVGSFLDANGASIGHIVVENKKGSHSLSVLDDAGASLAIVTQLHFSSEKFMDRQVFVNAYSNLGHKLKITGPNALEGIMTIFHPWRAVYGLTNSVHTFDDYYLSGLVMLFEMAFQPIIPATGCA